MSTNIALLDGSRFDPDDPISVSDLPGREIYTVAQVARMLNMNLGTVYHLLREGVIPAKRLGRRWVIPRKRFHRWLDGLSNGEA
ncbi:MAG: helix-turn-helix domain-containing protein [Pseudonocardiaceae bacterium]